jgi:hypothetical protein
MFSSRTVYVLKLLQLISMLVRGKRIKSLTEVFAWLSIPNRYSQPLPGAR